jgi:[acyl-carrier-protein] S-malonyltransferase
MSTALLFPGQGSQVPGMRELVERHAPELLEPALAEVGTDPFAQVDEGTAYAQPAILCASLAAWSAAGRPPAEFLAGHSLGELSALAAAGSIESAAAVQLAAIRGRLMQAAGGDRPGGMVALLGDGEAARAAAAEGGATVANDNGPTQIVVAGPAAVLDATVAAAKQRGVRVLRLPVAGAFHTSEIEPAVEPFRAALEEVEISAAQATVFSSSLAAPFPDDPTAIREALAGALVSPVRWRETLEQLYSRGVRRFLEAGPGKGLSRMVGRAFDDVEASVLELPETARV